MSSGMTTPSLGTSHAWFLSGSHVFVLSFKKLSVSMRPNNSAPRRTSKGTEDIDSPKGLYMNICSSIIPNSPKVETAQISMCWLMNKQNVEYLVNGILCTKKMNKVLICLTTWMNLEKIMLSERYQTQRTYCMIPFM